MPYTGDVTPLIEELVPMSLDQSIITDEILLRAKEELNETEETREAALKELKILLKGEKNLNANTSDTFLLQFLRAKKFKTQTALDLIKNYYGHRSSYPSLYKNYLPTQNLKVMNANLLNFLPWRTPDGCAIWTSRIGLWNPKEFDAEEFLRFGVMCPEKGLQNPVTQICGIVTIIDLQGFSWQHLQHISPSIVKCFVSMAQDCMPIRHKAIHIINNPSIFSFLFEVIKPFVSRKIRSRIHFHGHDLSGLHRFLHPSILPSEFGGTLGPVGNKKFYDSLLASEEEFLEKQKFGYKV